MSHDFDIEFTLDEPSDEQEEEAKQFAANLTDTYPQLAKNFTGKTCREILKVVGYCHH